MRKKPLSYYMRSLHRDIGFIVIGLTILYVVSGIMLIYRDSDFLKKDREMVKVLDPQLEAKDLGRALHIRGFKVLETVGDTLRFAEGAYNLRTGEARYTQHTIPPFLDKLNGIHKRSSRNGAHIFSVVYAALLGFLALSAFWMFKPGSRKFIRGLVLSAIGIAAALILVFA